MTLIRLETEIAAPAEACFDATRDIDLHVASNAGTRCAMRAHHASSNSAWFGSSGRSSASGDGSRPAMKKLPSGRNQKPLGSMTSGQAGSAAGQESTNTVRRLACTGRSMPAAAATARAHGPAAFTACLQEITGPSDKRTPMTLFPSS